MGDFYTIQSGDSLWRIAKSKLGPNATNAEIAEGTKNLYQANASIIGANPNLISAGNKLDLSIFEVKTPEVQETLYDKFEKADIQSQVDISRTAQDSGNPKGKLDLYDSELHNFKFTPEGYMDIQDAQEKTEAYKKSILELAEGEIKKYDANDDGVLDLGEYTTKLKDVTKKVSAGLDEEIDENIFSSDEFKSQAENIFNTLNVNSTDKTLDTKELAANYAYMDMNYAYNDNMKPTLDESGKQKIGLDGKIVFSSKDSEPDKAQMQRYYDTFFGNN